jgi:hypothetical protein
MQQLVAFERADTHLVSISVRAGSFMQLRGAGAGPQTQVPLGPTPCLVLGLEEPRAIDAQQIYAHLIGPHWELMPRHVRYVYAGLVQMSSLLSG